MKIEIRRTQFVNKGAELMHHAIMAQLKNNIAHYQLVMAPDLGVAKYLNRAELRMYQKVWLDYFNIQWGYLGKIIPKKIREMYGMILDSEVDVVLDSSGFSYSDQKDAYTTLATAKAIKKWKKRGTKVIFLPQAFGPFKGQRIKKAFKIIVECADIIFAREEASYNHIINLTGKRNNIKIAPDFTNLVEGIVPPYFSNQENSFCIIPNFRMIDKTDPNISKKYIPFLVFCIQYLYKKDVNPFILIHGGDEDRIISEEIIRLTKLNIKLINENNSLFIKGIIGKCRGVISSRFHGLVNALSQGVPALGTGWSHKYEMLFQEYNFPNGLIDVTFSEEKIKYILDSLLYKKNHQKITEILKNSSIVLEAKSIDMWNDVFKIIADRKKIG